MAVKLRHFCCIDGCLRLAVYNGMCADCASNPRNQAHVSEIGEWFPSETMLIYRDGEVQFELVSAKVDEVEWPDEIDPDWRF